MNINTILGQSLHAGPGGAGGGGGGACRQQQGNNVPNDKVGEVIYKKCILVLHFALCNVRDSESTSCKKYGSSNAANTQVVSILCSYCALEKLLQIDHGMLEVALPGNLPKHRFGMLANQGAST